MASDCDCAALRVMVAELLADMAYWSPHEDGPGNEELDQLKARARALGADVP